MPKIFLNPFSGNIDMAPDSNVKNIPFNAWYADESNPSPFFTKEWQKTVAIFNKGSQQLMRGQIKVMADYFAGQLLLRITFYSPATIGKVKLSLISTLKKQNADSSDDSLVYSSSREINLASSIPNKLYKVEFPLSNDNGELNGVKIGADDILDFALSRIDVADECVDDVRVYPACEIIKS